MKRSFGNKNTGNSGVLCAFPCIFQHVLFYLSFQAHKPDSLLGENLETAQTEKQAHIYYFSISICHFLLAMHPPPSPVQICPTSDAEGLGCGCIKLNEAATLERMPRNLWEFHRGSPLGTWFSRWQM